MLRDDCSAEVGIDEGVKYRQAIGKCMWMRILLRPDVAYLVKELARKTQHPTQVFVWSVKRVIRHVKGTLNSWFEMEIDESEPEWSIKAYSDSSWGSEEDRKSTSGGLLQIQGFTLLTWSRTQPVITLSSCEAELLACNQAALEAILVQHLLRELQLIADIVVYCDNSGTIRALMRRGCGHMKHIETRALWMQQEIARGVMSIEPVPGAENPADLFTKPLAGCKLRLMAERCGMRFGDQPQSVVELIEPERPIMMLEDFGDVPEASGGDDDDTYVHVGILLLISLGTLQLSTCCVRACRCLCRLCRCTVGSATTASDSQAELVLDSPPADRGDVRARGRAAQMSRGSYERWCG